MCGIAALLASPDLPPLPDWPFWRGTGAKTSATLLPNPSLDSLLQFLKKRGPDQTTTRNFQVDSTTTLQTVSTLLSIRTPPKLASLDTDNLTDVLLFNGEIYDLPPRTSDTEHARALISALPPDQPLTPLHLDALRGPWAIVLWRAQERRLYFARDSLGRRSLLLCALPGFLAVTSVANHPAFVEVPPIGVCYFDLSTRVFGVHSRPARLVLPMRLTDRPTDDVERGSYVSFLPLSWLRSVDTQQSSDLTPHQSVTQFLAFFHESVKRRLVTKQQSCSTKPRYATLFSGGVDSLLIAAVLDQQLPLTEPLHLINVAFGENRKALDSCPDRITAIKGASEVRALSQGRQIVLICVDVKPDEADKVLEKHVRSLLHPCDQPMDASIGTALWMAARGKGYISSADNDTFMNEKEVTSGARILFSGLGADELMGGYKGRHRTTFRRYGESGISREMDADLSRLWCRNLGRDDRLIGDHGKEVRHPFLDEDLVTFVTGLPVVEHVCDLSRPDGVGDKQLLRRALQRIGFNEEAVRRGKRAIQFGSRSKQVIERRRDG